MVDSAALEHDCFAPSPAAGLILLRFGLLVAHTGSDFREGAP
jgi:hypothetical protein